MSGFNVCCMRLPRVFKWVRLTRFPASPSASPVTASCPDPVPRSCHRELAVHPLSLCLPGPTLTSCVNMSVKYFYSLALFFLLVFYLIPSMRYGVCLLSLCFFAFETFLLFPARISHLGPLFVSPDPSLEMKLWTES